MNTYLGQKGYTIAKNEISIERQKQIKTDLTIRPFIPGAPPGTQNTFPAYRESAAKLYVPHYYGVEQFPAVITTLDPNRPIYDQQRLYLDAFASYRLKLTKKINTSLAACRQSLNIPLQQTL
jgi:hypothetical protein